MAQSINYFSAILYSSTVITAVVYCKRSPHLWFVWCGCKGLLPSHNDTSSHITFVCILCAHATSKCDTCSDLFLMRKIDPRQYYNGTSPPIYAESQINSLSGQGGTLISAEHAINFQHFNIIKSYPV